MEVHVRPVDLHCEAKLLGLSVATLSTVTHYGLHFTLLSNISLESNSYRVIHHTAFYFGICLSMTLILAALLSSAATVRESQLLTAMGFFCFALAFCGLIPAACWRYTHSTEGHLVVIKPSIPRSIRCVLCCIHPFQERVCLHQLPLRWGHLKGEATKTLTRGKGFVLKATQNVEDSMMDVYDLVYEEVRRNASSFRRHELTAIHEAFLCCGKHSPFGDTANVETKTCPSSQVRDVGQDCLQEIRDFLKKHMDLVSTLLGIAIGFTVYGMILTSFLWFSIHFSSNLDRKGKYILRER
ncbi:tetraspanin-32 isoform X3 [Rissa tridactyla]|uniref:tetraspanin-32 isoform X3 n=1 Tax=Rissa tridactyla TaxID=75485 RepID=UPI0023BA9F62|nr:tetraspanin-32 isoform X3 [Rissa tridactyla]